MAHKHKMRIAGLVMISTIWASSGPLIAASALGPNCEDVNQSRTVIECQMDGSTVLKHISGLGVEKPEKGSALEQIVEYKDGNWAKFRATTDKAGSVTTFFEQSEGSNTEIQLEASDQIPGLSSSNCGSASYNKKFPWSPNQPTEWWYRYADQPDSNSLPRIKEAFATWSKGANRCNSTLVPTSFKSTYMGLTTLALPYNDDQSSANFGACKSPGSKDMVGWAVLPIDVLARTCTTYYVLFNIQISPSRSSVILSSNTNWYASLDVTGCTGEKFDLKAVATHEFGHVLGLDHYTHEGQVMTPYSDFCGVDQRGLGYGDVHGVADKYPAS